VGYTNTLYVLNLTASSVHAAIALATLLDNPSPTDDALFVNMGIYNARERLRMPYSQRLQYTGTATVASILQAPVSSVLGTNDVQRRLDIISHELKSQYSRQRSFPALLGVNATMVDMIMPSYKAASCVFSRLSQTSPTHTP
jgi:hypothetical protein